MESSRLDLKSAQPKRSDIPEKIYRMDFEHGRKARKAAQLLHKNVYRVPRSYSENRNMFFKPSPAGSVSSLCQTTSKEREFSGLGRLTSHDE